LNGIIDRYLGIVQQYIIRWQRKRLAIPVNRVRPESITSRPIPGFDRGQNMDLGKETKDQEA
jgi:hypothetical protein